MTFSTEDLQELMDDIVDAHRLESYSNPIVDFLIKKTQYTRKEVDAAFRYMKYFGRFSKMPFSNLLQSSKPGSDFWWHAFSLYDINKMDNGYKEMYDFVISSLSV